MSNAIEVTYHKCSYGELFIGTYDNQLVLCDWRYRKMRHAIDDRVQKFCNAAYVEKTNDLQRIVMIQLKEYFSGHRKVFDLPLYFAGTLFQQRVWQALVEVPYGSTSTYMQQAVKLGDANAIRATATANGANAISIIVPCHRIVGSDGSMVGYAGGTSVKKKLLALEGLSWQGELF